MNSDRPARPQELLDQVRAALRTRHYAIRTEEAYEELLGHKDVQTTMNYT